MEDWAADQYLRFERERTRPVRDLLAAIPDISARAVIDLGCGPGNSTELLAQRFPAASIRGIDESGDMIAAARTRLPGVKFEHRTIEHWLASQDSVDVILANAVLQWVPDHEALFPALVARLASGGCLAVQMPDNLLEPAHVAMCATAVGGPWAHKLAGVGMARAEIVSAARYHELLQSVGCNVDVWRTTYHHALAGGAAAVVEWFLGSGLRPFLAPLDPVERTDFLKRYENALAHAYPVMRDGSVLLPFPRLFLIAVAP